MPIEALSIQLKDAGHVFSISIFRHILVDFPLCLYSSADFLIIEMKFLFWPVRVTVYNIIPYEALYQHMHKRNEKDAAHMIENLSVFISNY